MISRDVLKQIRQISEELKPIDRSRAHERNTNLVTTEILIRLIDLKREIICNETFVFSEVQYLKNLMELLDMQFRDFLNAQQMLNF